MGPSNFVTASKAGEGRTGMFSSMLVMAAGIVIAIVYRASVSRGPARERMAA